MVGLKDVSLQYYPVGSIAHLWGVRDPKQTMHGYISSQHNVPQFSHVNITTRQLLLP